MKTAFAGRFVALTMLAGLVTAAFPIHAEPVEAAMTWQADEACAGQTTAQPARASYAALTTPAFQGIGSEPEILGAALGPFPADLGEPEELSVCPPRRCQADAIFIDCCGRFRILGNDSRGACTVRQRCGP